MTDRRRARVASGPGPHASGRPRRGHHDHETSTVVLPPGSRSAERWARATFDGAPAVVRSVLVLGWRRVLGLRLVSADDRVLGWRLERVDDEAGGDQDSVVLEARSSAMRATLTFTVRGDELTVTGRREVDGTAAWMLWRAMRPVHRFLAPRLVRAAVRRSTRARGSRARRAR